jgi:hypothetical protein
MFLVYYCRALAMFLPRSCCVCHALATIGLELCRFCEEPPTQSTLRCTTNLRCRALRCSKGKTHDAEPRETSMARRTEQLLLRATLRGCYTHTPPTTQTHTYTHNKHTQQTHAHTHTHTRTHTRTCEQDHGTST